MSDGRGRGVQVAVAGLSLAAIALTATSLVGCSGGGDDGDDDDDRDAAPHLDAAAHADAAPLADAPSADAAADAAAADAASALPLPGFGDLSGMCGVLAAAELDGTNPLLFAGALAFADRYDDPEDRPQLTAGGQEIILDGNAGGSSLYSEVFSFEVLARCELAALLKTETEIVYDVEGKKTDLLVMIDDRKIGVSVTRAVTFPFGEPYTTEAATELIERKLDDIQLSSAGVAAEDHWEKQILAILAYDEQHAEVAAATWAGLDVETRADSIVLIMTTGGDDLFIYTDQ